MECPECGISIEYWWTSGMSMAFPHFYCEDCGSPIVRHKDKAAVWYIEEEEELRTKIDEIIAELPPCHCGGRYTLDGCPRCPKCKYRFSDEKPFKERVYMPHIYLLTGAKMLVEK